MRGSQWTHQAESLSMQAHASEEGQVWHIAATLLYDHEPMDVANLLRAMQQAERSPKHRAALLKVGGEVLRWK